MRELDTVIHKNESHRLKMQRDLVVVFLDGSIYNQYKIVKKKNKMSLIGLKCNEISLSLLYMIVSITSKKL